MNKPLSEKEKLVTMLTEIYDQLEELELVLEASFSDLRISLNKEEQDKIKISEQKLSVIDQIIGEFCSISNEEVTSSSSNQKSRSLQLELGF
jgi:exoribonuclease R